MHTTQRLDPSLHGADALGAPIDVQHMVRIAAPVEVVRACLLEDESPQRLMWHVVEASRVSDNAWIWQFVLSRNLWWAWDCERVVAEDGTGVTWQSLSPHDPHVRVAFDLLPLQEPAAADRDSDEPAEAAEPGCEVVLHLTANSHARFGRWAMAHTQAVAEQFAQHTLRELQRWAEGDGGAALGEGSRGLNSVLRTWLEGLRKGMQ